jgi:hypothetical protein
MLIPETPTQLAEGDVITFGKSVGSRADLVRPVVARVELRYRRGLKPFLTPPSSVIHLDLTKGSPKSSSGRYGLYDSSSSSSDDGSSVMSDHDSDIEEILVSGANAVPLQPRGSHSSEKGSNLTRAFEVLKRLIPPVHAPPPLTSQEHQQSEASDPFASYLPPLDLSEEYYYDSPTYSPASPRSISPMFNMPSSPPNNSLDNGRVTLDPRERSASPQSPDPSNDLDGFHGLRNLKYIVRSESDARSKSSSPMDLASSPPFSHHPSPVPEQAIEPSIIGAYPKSCPSSPSASSPSRPAPATRIEEVAVTDMAQADAEAEAVVDSARPEEEEEANDADADAETDNEEAEAEAAGADSESEHAEVKRSPEPLCQAPQAPVLDDAKNVAPDASNSCAAAVTSDVTKLRIGLTELQVYFLMLIVELC